MAPDQCILIHLIADHDALWIADDKRIRHADPTQQWRGESGLRPLQLCSEQRDQSSLVKKRVLQIADQSSNEIIYQQ